MTIKVDIRDQLGSALHAISADAFDRLLLVDAARKVEDRLVEDLWIELRTSAFPSLWLQLRGGQFHADLACPGLFANEFKLAYRGEHSYPGNGSWRASAREDVAKLRLVDVPHRLFTQIVSFGPSGKYQKHRSCACSDRAACIAAWTHALGIEGLIAPRIFSRGIFTLLMFEVLVDHGNQ